MPVLSLELDIWVGFFSELFIMYCLFSQGGTTGEKLFKKQTKTTWYNTLVSAVQYISNLTTHEKLK